MSDTTIGLDQIEEETLAYEVSDTALETAAGHCLNAPRHADARLIPFEFEIKLPAPLKTGVDYGFLPGSNISKRETRHTSATT